MVAQSLWTKVDLYGANNDGEKIRYAIANGDTVSQGQLLTLVDPRTASAAIVTSKTFIGIASEDHVPNQGITSISVWTNGIFEAKASGAIALGSAITGAESSEIMTAGLVASGACLALGKALETATDAETINVRLGPL